MANVPDEAILRSDEISSSAFRLYAVYCMRRNSKTGGYSTSKATALSLMSDISEATYFRSKKELVKKDWITVSGDFVSPNIGFETCKNESETIKNDSDGTRKNDSQTRKNASRTRKNDSSTRKNESTRNIVYHPDNHPDNQTETNQQVGGEVSDSSGKTKNNGKGKKDADVPTSDMVAVFDRWREVTGSPRSTFTVDRQRKIRARLVTDKFTVDQLFECLEGWKLSPWHQGNNPSSTVYDKIETIFRNAEQVEKFIKLVSRPDVVWTDPEESDFKNPVKFADAMDLNFAVFCPDGDPRELFEKTKANYLARNKGEEFEAEVAAYEQNDEFRERLEKAGS